MKLLICTLLMIGFHSAYAASLNDVSILLPLPTVAEFPALLAPAESGSQGALLPQDFYAKLPQLMVETDNKVTYQNTLRVVGIRLDPCFVEAPITGCRRQVRLVWQPVLRINSTVLTRDAAVHTFYEFDEQSWSALIQKWRTLSSGKPSDALQVHPLIKEQTLRGPQWQKLRALLLEFCGQRNLTRVTAMTIFGNERIWEFLGFDIVNGQIKPLGIPRANSQSQLAAVNIDVPKEFIGAVKPQPNSDLNFFKVIRHSAQMKSTLSEPDLKAVIATAFDYENPKVHNTATLDCASCHMAESVRRWGQQSFPSWSWSADFKNRYANPWFRVDTASPFSPNQFRAFGYFFKEPVISQRVYNETIEVVKSLQQTARQRATLGP